MKKLLIILCLLICLPCFSMESLTSETVKNMDSHELIKLIKTQEKELDSTDAFQADFTTFFRNLIIVGNALERLNDLDTIQTSYPYNVYPETDLFLKSIYNWTFTVPNSIYLHRKYKNKLSNDWNTYLKIHSSKNHLNMYENALLDNSNMFFREYIKLIYLKLPNDILRYCLDDYEYYINNQMFEDQSHLNQN